MVPHASSLLLRSSVLLLCLLVPLSALRAEDSPVATESELALWADMAHLEDELMVAIVAVSVAEGKPFKQKPRVKITEQTEMEGILEGEIGAMFRRLGSTAAQTKAALRLLSGSLVMKYEPEKHVVHVMPQNVERILKLLDRPDLGSRDMLRITMIHEAAHGHDFQYYPHLDVERRERKTTEGIQAIGAVVEGHAQYVTAKVAKKLGLEKAFAQLVELTVAAPPTDDAATKVLMDIRLAEQRFAYVGGHRFFDAVFAARGEEGVRAALSNPPGHVRMVEEPEAYLDPSTSKQTIDSKAVFAPLLKWNNDNQRKATEFPFRRGQLAAVFNLLPATETAQMRGAFQEGWGIASMLTGQADMVAVILSEYTTAEAATGYLSNMRALLDKKGELMKEGTIRILETTYEDVVGSKAAFSGFVCTRKISANGSEATVVIHAAQVDRYAFDITFMDENIDRAVQSTLVGEMVKALEAQLSGAAGRSGDGEALKKLAQAFHAAQMSRDEDALEKLGRALCPSSAELNALCRESEATTAFLAAYRGPRQEQILGQPGAARGVGSKVFQPGDAARTEILIHAATTEEIVGYEEGSVAHKEFPGGMRRFAERVAAPGRMWFIVELLEPGKPSGMKYTCFTKVGDRFVVVLKPWRAIPREAPQEAVEK